MLRHSHTPPSRYIAILSDAQLKVLDTAPRNELNVFFHSLTAKTFGVFVMVDKEDSNDDVYFNPNQIDAALDIIRKKDAEEEANAGSKVS